MERRKSNIQSFIDQQNSESLASSINMEKGVIYVGYNPLLRGVRMEWLDEHGNVQVREEPCEMDSMFPHIKKTFSRMYEKHLNGHDYGTRVEDLTEMLGVVSIEMYSERKDRKQYLQDLLIGKEPSIEDDWIQTMDISSAFEDGEEHTLSFRRVNKDD